MEKIIVTPKSPQKLPLFQFQFIQISICLISHEGTNLSKIVPEEMTRKNFVEKNAINYLNTLKWSRLRNF